MYINMGESLSIINSYFIDLSDRVSERGHNNIMFEY